MVRPIKNKQIPNIQEVIKETAWQQIAEYGSPALSLRAIARELKITAPAIYNYFPDRDALVTSLIIDAFTSRYQLIFGTPIPGYKGHMEKIFPSSARSLSALVSVVEGLRVAGKLNVRAFPKVKPEYKISFETWKTYGGNAD